MTTDNDCSGAIARKGAEKGGAMPRCMSGMGLGHKKSDAEAPPGIVNGKAKGKNQKAKGKSERRSVSENHIVTQGAIIPRQLYAAAHQRRCAEEAGGGNAAPDGPAVRDSGE